PARWPYECGIIVTKKCLRLVVLGSEPEIYFYSGRQSATGFIYMYPLMEQQRFALQMQRQMIEEVEANRPGFVVWVWTPMSWRVAARSERLLFQWADQYLNDNNRPVGIDKHAATRPDRLLSADGKW